MKAAYPPESREKGYCDLRNGTILTLTIGYNNLSLSIIFSFLQGGKGEDIRTWEKKSLTTQDAINILV